MSVQTVTQRLAAMCREIDGVNKVFDNIPRALQDADLPAFVIYPGRGVIANVSITGENDLLEQRTYTLTLYLMQATLGSTYQAQIAIVPFFDRVRDYFMARPGLETGDNPPADNRVYDTQWLGDNGFDVLRYPLSGAPYAAIEFSLRVDEWAVIAYQD